MLLNLLFIPFQVQILFPDETPRNNNEKCGQMFLKYFINVLKGNTVCECHSTNMSANIWEQKHKGNTEKRCLNLFLKN